MFKKLNENGLTSFSKKRLINQILWLNGFSKISDAKKITENTIWFNKCPVLDKSEEFKNILLSNKFKKIGVCGDYDGDGVYGTSIMIKLLNTLKIDNTFVIPDRKQGFGMNSMLVDELIDKGCDCIITVDNGSKAYEAIKYAKEKGIFVIVTDHHDYDERVIALADLFINPHYKNDDIYPNICGAMVAYSLAEYILKDKITVGKMEQLKELAAMATVTDVMPLFYFNRNIVKRFVAKAQGDVIRNAGIRMLMKVSNCSVKNFTSTDMGFSLGPLSNAPGRLDKADIVVHLLTSTSKQDILNYAKKIKDLNEKRKILSRELNALALEQIGNDSNAYNVNVITFDNAHEGLIGITAGHVTERTGRPTFVFVKTESGTYKGSGRSPLNYNLIKGATKVFEKRPELVIGYGGHAGAMGLTLANENAVNEFRKEMHNEYASQNIAEIERLYIDYPKELETKTLLEQLAVLQPYGQEIQEPLFRVEGKILSSYVFAEKHTNFSVLIDKEKNTVLNFMIFFNVLKDIKNKNYEIYFTISKEGTGLKGLVVDMKEVNN